MVVRSLVVHVPGVASERPDAWPEIDWITRCEPRSGAGRGGLALTPDPAPGSRGVRDRLRAVWRLSQLDDTGTAVEV
ncbi:MAG: hypothetical protein ACRD0K_01490 [Egibacteraceae bacterium]